MFLSAWVIKTSTSANASLKASFVDLKSLGAHKEWFEQVYWLVELWYQNRRELMVPYHLFGGAIMKLLLFFHRWFCGLLDCFLSWLRGVYHRLTILFQILLARSSLRRGRCACVSSKGWLLFSWTSEGGDIFFGLFCRDIYHIAGGRFGLAFELLVCDGRPLLAFNNVRMDPHCLSLRSMNRKKTFLLLVVRIYIDHS